MPATDPTAAASRRIPAWLLSVWVHGSLVAVMAMIRFAADSPPPAPAIVTSLPEAAEAMVVLPRLGGDETGSPPPVAVSPTPASANAPSLLAVTPASATATAPAPVTAPPETPSGEGTGTGSSGEGTGSLPAFLDGQGAGGRLVYVVDCSKSMRKPFPSPERHRLGRVKRELISSIRSLSAEQRFYVIFFNDQAIPMPGGTYVAGGPLGARHVAEWIEAIRGGGQTDPESALVAALSLRPDAVFFLTDGDFKKSTVDRVVQLNQRGTRVHTIGFGDDVRKRHPDSRRRTGPTLAEYLLTDLAQRTGGTVKFIATETPPRRTAAR